MANILSQGSFWVLNKKFTQAYGLDPSFLLTDLISRFEYWRDHGKLDSEGCFFCNKEEIEESTTLSPYRQTDALKVLVEIGVVEVKRRGVPAKFYYNVNTERVNELVLDLYIQKATR